ncbi:MAG: hypothetical protein ACKOAK_08530 [Ignavibacteria bacterium]
MILPFSGTMLFLHYEKGRAKRHMIEILKKKEAGEILTLTLQRAEFLTLRWEHDLEFEHKGEMYDLVSRESIGNLILLHCIHDKKETSINKSIVKFIAGFLNSNPFHDQQLTACIEFTKHLAPILSIKPYFLSTFTAMMHVISDIVKPQFGFYNPIFPPPKYS